MIFDETRLKGAFIIKPDKERDDQGFFTRAFSQNEFLAKGLNATIVQSDISYTREKGTFRGMHFQAPPFEDDKIVSCSQGAIMDYILDLRADSPTFKEWIKVELSVENGHSVYVPKSFAHGFYTLRDNTQVLYQMTQYYDRKHAFGFRFDDPAFDINLPSDLAKVSERDRSYPDLYLLPF